MDFSAQVEVFEHDIYTVVLASDPTRISAALSEVPARKRPAANPELFEFYRDAFPDRSVALCCFDNAEAGSGHRHRVFRRTVAQWRLRHRLRRPAA